uniref:Reverse transcriptase zinc-binding domain-containing protein n=1 Tax=Hordeum vulgare subsp. vulgare TaxID=112509 RepID=A0A8I6WA49_HORVV
MHQQQLSSATAQRHPSGIAHGRGAATLKTAFPSLFKHSRRKHRTVQEALTNNTWLADLAHGNNAHLWEEVIRLHRWLQDRDLHLKEETTHTITWNLEASGTYTARSAYKAQFQGVMKSDFKKIIWMTWAPPRLKIFAWLLLRDRLWCNDRLQRRGWPNGYFCQLCLRNLETSTHLFWECPMSLGIWAHAASRAGCASLYPDTWATKMGSAHKIATIVEMAPPVHRKATRTMIVLILSEIWKHRNDCTFTSKQAHIQDIKSAITRTVELWRQAGASFLEHPFWDPS